MIESRTGLRPTVSCVASEAEFVADKNDRVLSALALANEIHKEDFRKTGEQYIVHCIVVAEILCRWGADEDEIIAGLLHDTVEDHPEAITLEKIEMVFGERVAHLVDGVSKFRTSSGDNNDFETLRKVTRETLVEPGIAKVKLADRLHNMLTMESMPLESRVAKAKETLAVYVPLAESLGLWQVKNALADISFSYIDPVRFNEVKQKIDGDPRLNEIFIGKTEEDIRRVLVAGGVNASVEHQVGGYWELSEKQKKSAMRSDSRPKEFADITDVVSFRVITDNEENVGECYLSMGLVRTRYHKLLQQSRSDDYLATPAINGYSALHDTYKLNEGNIEVAFTTTKRERFNNWGVASLSIEELRTDPDKYKRKLIFTPKQELAVMELSARGIDVAYRLNPLLGLRAVAIKIDGRVENLDTVVPNASVVEIITDQHQTKPNVDWLTFCNRETVGQIDSQMRNAEHDMEVAKGEKILVDGLLRERGILNIEDLDEDIVDKLLVDLGCWYGIDDLYYKVAYGLDLSLVARKLDEMKVGRGMFTTVLIEGSNSIGISEEVAGIIGRNGGDVRSKVEKVDRNEQFVIRMLLAIDYQGKKKIEEELKQRFPSCVVV
ncbi:MAG TPA: HD domain-containing protein [Spirochaetia bacterium]|nr:HD domain-containing protein [Spirochaetia bacterium]